MPEPATAAFPVPADLKPLLLIIAEVKVTRRGPVPVPPSRRPVLWPAGTPNLGLVWERYLPAHDLKEVGNGRTKSPAGVDFTPLAAAGCDRKKLSAIAARWRGFGVLEWYSRSAAAQARPTESLLDALHARRLALVKRSEPFACPVYTVHQGLTIGMGLPATLENSGVAFERTYGFPILPGKSLKGLALHFLLEEIGGLGKVNRRWIGPAMPAAKALAQTGLPPNEAAALLDQLPGRKLPGSERNLTHAESPYSLLELQTICFGSPEREGAVQFNDGWPLPAPDGWAAPAVLTPHHKHHLADQRDGEHPVKTHLDQELPEPAHFLTVKRGVQFVIPLAVTSGGRGLPSEALTRMLTFVRCLLDRALSEWGVGGRSGAGFGRMIFDGFR